MKPETSSIDEFFQGLPKEDKQQADIFNENPQKPTEEVAAATTEAGAKVEVKPEEGEEPRKNRRHRRLEEQLQKERELRIAAEAKAEGRSEVEKFNQTSNGDVDPEWLQIYGDTPESRRAWGLFEKMSEKKALQAKEEALEEIRKDQIAEAEEERVQEAYIDSQFESIEDEFNIDLTSDSPAARKRRSEFIDLVEALSPKDQNGDLVEYADFHNAWELYQEKQAQPDNTRQREIAARSMVKTGSTVGNTQKAPTPGFNGWKIDLGLE